MIGQTISHYRILEKVGEGGMGQVYRACDEHLSRDVALKVFPPGTLVDESARKRFRKEARALSQLSHPNIATLYDFDNKEGVDFLAMEYIGGQGLGEKIATGPLPEREIAQLGAQLAEGLVAAHAVHVIHCDIKPDNLRITPEGRLKIVDFGLAKITQPPRTDRITTSSVESHAVAGTLPYMAPEQVSSQPLDPRTDIYSAGAVLYEMATGKRPFREDTNLQLADAILHKPLTPPSRWNDRISPQLENAILKCLEKDPGDRYATAADLLVDLRALQRPKSESSARFSVRPRRKRRRAIAAGIATIVCIAALAAVPALRQRVKRWMNVDPVPSEKLVAVLPFTVVGGDEQAIPFSEGLTETLTAKLTQLTVDPKLQVVPAPEIREKGTKLLDDVRHEFGVTMVLQGNLYWFKDNLRINMALVDTRTRHQLRAESFTVPAADPFLVQDKVVTAAITMLELDVQPDALTELSAHNTQSASAYDLYLQGLGYLQNYDKKENIESAIRVFNNALNLDPNYAAAYAGRGDADWQMYDSTKDAKWIETSREDCERALKLNESLPVAHACLGSLDKGTGHYAQAAQEFERAVAGEPTNDRAYLELAETYDLLGNPQEAEATYRRAIKLRPHYWAGYNWLGAFYYQRAQYQDAAKMFEQVTLLAPDNVRGLFNLGTTYVSQGRYTDAISVLKRSIAIRPEASAYTDLGNAYFYLREFEQATAAYERAVNLEPAEAPLWWNLGDGYYWTPGKRSQAPAAYQKAISIAHSNLQVNPQDAYILGILAICHAMLEDKKPALEALQAGLRLSPNDPETRFKAALVYKHLGDVPQSLNWLDKAASVGFSKTIIRDTPDFDDLRNDARFQKWLVKQDQS